MSDLLFLIGIFSIVMLLDLLACEGNFFPAAWRWTKDKIIDIAIYARWLLGREPEPTPPVREPDWADAADEVGFFDPIPEPLWSELVLWTPAEREAYDLDSTAEFIRWTDDLLAEHDKLQLELAKKEAWEDWNRRMDESEAQMLIYRKAEESRAAKAARRFGANLLPDSSDDRAALRELNRKTRDREVVIRERLS